MIFARLEEGFTLIEILVVIAIIGILTTVALPTYQKFIISTHRSACLAEAKGYSNDVFYMLNGSDETIFPNAPITKACQSITDATGWTLETQEKIIAVAKSPSNVRIECDVPNGTPCLVVP